MDDLTETELIAIKTCLEFEIRFMKKGNTPSATHPYTINLESALVKTQAELDKRRNSNAQRTN